jgi:type IV pilus assembly protein PilE
MLAHRPARRRAARPEAGFTIIELMIALLVMAIIVALAYPTFIESVRKGRRSEAVAEMAKLQQGQERWRANNPAYTTALSNTGASATTAGGYYTLSINAASATGYTATAVAAGSQVADARCASMRIKVDGANILYGSACSTCTLADPPTDPNRCWYKQ